VNKLTNSTKINYLGGLVCDRGEVAGLWGTCLIKDVYSGHCSGWPLRIKEITMSSMFRVLPVQPYDIMGSVLIEYD
jgi:hypothetical protein